MIQPDSPEDLGRFDQWIRERRQCACTCVYRCVLRGLCAWLRSCGTVFWTVARGTCRNGDCLASAKLPLLSYAHYLTPSPGTLSESCQVVGHFSSFQEAQTTAAFSFSPPNIWIIHQKLSG